ncbi:MAG: HAMP domain-containing sensor histidine kinase [Jatrophihabitantaceae bacterium]
MRRRILLLVVGMTTLVVVAFAIPVGILLHSAVAQRAEQATLDQAKNAAFFLGSGPTKSKITTYVQSVSANTGRPTSVTLADGTTIGTTPSDPRTAQFTPRGARNGFPNLPGGGGPEGGAPNATLHPIPGGQLAETTARTSTTFYFIRVYLSNDALHAGEAKWWFLLVGGGLGLLLLGALAAELLTRRIVRPLVRTADTAQQLAVGDTTARAPTDGPREIAEVGSALNRLADRIDELIAEERETVADLSHRLRTPLTALRLDAEALRDPEDAERVGNHVSTLERMLTAIIHAARRPQREGRMPASDATSVVGERVSFWSALADEQERPTEVNLPESPLPVRTSAEDLAATVDALLENVIAHTPEGTAFSVRLVASDEGAVLEVSDAGPGLPEDALVRGRSDRGSTGLGLDIARRCAEGSGGTMTLGRSAAGGALITLLLHWA